MAAELLQLTQRTVSSPVPHHCTSPCTTSKSKRSTCGCGFPCPYCGCGLHICRRGRHSVPRRGHHSGSSPWAPCRHSLDLFRECTVLLRCWRGRCQCVAGWRWHAAKSCCWAQLIRRRVCATGRLAAAVATAQTQCWGESSQREAAHWGSFAEQPCAETLQLITTLPGRCTSTVRRQTLWGHCTTRVLGLSLTSRTTGNPDVWTSAWAKQCTQEFGAWQ